MILHGDNLDVLPTLPLTSVTLCYLDPPFFTGRDFGAFDDRWPDLDSYLSALGQRLVAIRPLLAPHGCVVVHVDPRAAAYVRVRGDEVFGRAAFASEIVWRYRRWPSRTPNFQRVHDVLLRWIVDPRQARWHQLYEPLAASTVATWGTRRQLAVTDASGRRRRSSTTAAESPGVPMGDVWEIPIVAPVARERTGYPTQKPEALLERLMLATTDPGDLVLDPYCGSGTTVAVALRLGRVGVGIDQSQEAVRVARGRCGMAA